MKVVDTGVATGWYGRATENGHKACATRHVHMVKDGMPICGYVPHKTMQFQFCSAGFDMGYVSCPKCKEKSLKLEAAL